MAERLFSEEFLNRLERLALAARHARTGGMQGERRSPKRGQSVEFADFRPYVPGDDFRRIDWNAYARLERFFIKLFVEEEDLLIHLLVDTSRSMDWGEPKKLWYAVRAAAALGYVGLASLDRVTITAVGPRSGMRSGNGSGASNTTGGTPYYFPPHRGKNRALALFSFLQNLTAAPSSDLPLPFNPAQALRTYAAQAGTPGPLLLFSDLMDEGWMDGLRVLASRGFEVTLVHIMAPEEIDPEINGDFRLLDSESRSLVDITADYELLERYRQGLAEWRAELRAFCAPRGMHYVPVATTLPFDELLFAWMRRQGVMK
jgi:uncharacterized protein (DUF58 family)